MGKSLLEAGCHWFLRLESYFVSVAVLRTLRAHGPEPISSALKTIPLSVLTNKDAQAPANLLHLSSPAVLQALSDAKTVVHTLVPEQHRVWTGNDRRLLHPIAVTWLPSANGVAFVEADSGAIRLARLHSPADVRLLATSAETVHGLAQTKGILLVTMPQTAEIRYLELKAGSSEVKVSGLDMPTVRQMLHERGENTDDGRSGPELRKCLKTLLTEERVAEFGPDANGEAKDEAPSGNRARIPKAAKTLRSLELSGARLQAPLAIAAHPSNFQVAVSDSKVPVISIVTLSVSGIHLRGKVTVIKDSGFKDGSQLNSLAWRNAEQLLVVDSSSAGGLFLLYLQEGHCIQRQCLLQHSIVSPAMPRQLYGVCVSRSGAILVSDADRRTVYRVQDFKDQAGTAIPLLGDSKKPAAFRDGTASNATFVQPMGLAAEGESIFICDAGAGAIR